MADNRNSPPVDRTVAGLAFAFGAFLIWGLSPIYFKALGGVPATEIVSHRIVWSVLLVGAVVLTLKSPADVVRAVGGWRRLGTYLLTTLLVSANWLIFIWAVTNGHLIQSSLGYYINPLVNVVLGVAFLGESLSRRQFAAVLLAAAGVLSLVLSYGEVPWIALSLALSFGFYALVRKKARIDPQVGFLVETALLAPAALGYLGWLEVRGAGAFGNGSLGFDLLLAASGAVTAVPLILFMYGAQRLKLSTIGLMQYLAPTCQFLLGVFLYGEAFTGSHAIAFGCIWLALAVYSADAFTTRRTAKPA